jgi:hypothetical protein
VSRSASSPVEGQVERMKAVKILSIVKRRFGVRSEVANERDLPIRSQSVQILRGQSRCHFDVFRPVFALADDQRTSTRVNEDVRIRRIGVSSRHTNAERFLLGGRDTDIKIAFLERRCQIFGH